MRVLDLFSGIGGFTLGLDRAGMTTAAFCEADKKCQLVLRKHWKETPIFGDIYKLDSESIGNIDLVCGGFPCQPFSTASRGQKTAVDLWPEMLRVVSLIKPQWVIAENVLPAPIEIAKKDVENLNYAVWTKRIGAHDAGADHKRDRWWIVAHANNQGEFHSALDAEVEKLQELCSGLWGSENYARAIRVSDGVSGRMDRFKQLGNTVLPQIPEALGRAILSV